MRKNAAMISGPMPQTSPIVSAIGRAAVEAMRDCRRDRAAIMARAPFDPMRKAWLFFSQTVTVAVALLFVVATLKPDGCSVRQASRRRARRRVAPAAALPPPVRSVSLIGAGTAPSSYSAAAKRASPAVVSITASRAGAQRRAHDPMFRFFFGDRRASAAGAPGRPRLGRDRLARRLPAHQQPRDRRRRRRRGACSATAAARRRRSSAPTPRPTSRCSRSSSTSCR